MWFDLKAQVDELAGERQQYLDFSSSRPKPTSSRQPGHDRRSERRRRSTSCSGAGAFCAASPRSAGGARPAQRIPRAAERLAAEGRGARSSRPWKLRTEVALTARRIGQRSRHLLAAPGNARDRAPFARVADDHRRRGARADAQAARDRAANSDAKRDLEMALEELDVMWKSCRDRRRCCARERALCGVLRVRAGCLLITDAGGRIREANQAALELLNTARDEVGGGRSPITSSTPTASSSSPAPWILSALPKTLAWTTGLQPRGRAAFTCALSVRAIPSESGVSGLSWLIRAAD